MDESPLLPDQTRPNAGGSYVRLPDGRLMPEADWLAAQAAPQPQAEGDGPSLAQPTEAAPARGGRGKKEG